jgi:hypothetical protein
LLRCQGIYDGFQQRNLYSAPLLLLSLDSRTTAILLLRCQGIYDGFQQRNPYSAPLLLLSFFASCFSCWGLFLENFHCNVEFSTNLFFSFFFLGLTWLLKVPGLGIWQFRSSLVIWRAIHKGQFPSCCASFYYYYY